MPCALVGTPGVGGVCGAGEGGSCAGVCPPRLNLPGFCPDCLILSTYWSSRKSVSPSAISSSQQPEQGELLHHVAASRHGGLATRLRNRRHGRTEFRDLRTRRSGGLGRHPRWRGWRWRIGCAAQSPHRALRQRSASGTLEKIHDPATPGSGPELASGSFSCGETLSTLLDEFEILWPERLPCRKPRHSAAGSNRTLVGNIGPQPP